MMEPTKLPNVWNGIHSPQYELKRIDLSLIIRHHSIVTPKRNSSLSEPKYSKPLVNYT